MHCVKVDFSVKDLRGKIPARVPNYRTTRRIILVNYFLLLVCNFEIAVHNSKIIRKSKIKIKFEGKLRILDSYLLKEWRKFLCRCYVFLLLCRVALLHLLDHCIWVSLLRVEFAEGT